MKDFEVIIIGGSYAGLAAAMSLGRALRKTLVIDSGLPCNRFTPHSHNFITHDGNTPKAIAEAAKVQVLQYDTVTFHNDLAVSGTNTGTGVEITTRSGQVLTAKKLIFATGIRDIIPDIAGFTECWGVSVLHCPYCHGYEVRHEPTGILLNGDMAFEFSKLISNWTNNLTLFTNGASTLSAVQNKKLAQHGIKVVEQEIKSLEHNNGILQRIVLSDGSAVPLRALYTKLPFEQHCDIPVALGCALNEHGLLHVDALQRTSIAGVYACGDNVTPMRSVASAVGAGTFTGASVNKDLVDEVF